MLLGDTVIQRIVEAHTFVSIFYLTKVVSDDFA